MAERQTFVAARIIDVFVGIAMLVVVVSLYDTWFSTYWPGNYEFYAGGESAFAARGYSVQIAIRLIVVNCLGTPALLMGTAALRAFVHEFRWPSERLHRRLLFGLTWSNLSLVLLAFAFPPRTMVVFPPIQLCRGGYLGLLAAVLAALGAASALLLPDSNARSSDASGAGGSLADLGGFADREPTV